MVTKAKIVRDINWIRTNSPVQFSCFGKFFFGLMLLPVEDQEYITDSLKNAAMHAKPEDMIVIRSINRPVVELKENERQYRFTVEHDFKCKFCGHTITEEVNLCSGQFRSLCEFCNDKAYEYGMDAVPELSEDHD